MTLCSQNKQNKQKIRIVFFLEKKPTVVRQPMHALTCSMDSVDKATAMENCLYAPLIIHEQIC
jgi:hypothetical protein